MCVLFSCVVDLQTDLHMERNKTYGLLPSGDGSSGSSSSVGAVNGLGLLPASSLDDPVGLGADSYPSDVPNHQAPPPPVCVPLY